MDKTTEITRPFMRMMISLRVSLFAPRASWLSIGSNHSLTLLPRLLPPRLTYSGRACPHPTAACDFKNLSRT